MRGYYRFCPANVKTVMSTRGPAPSTADGRGVGLIVPAGLGYRAPTMASGRVFLIATVLVILGLGLALWLRQPSTPVSPPADAPAEPPPAEGAPDIDDGADELDGDAIAAAWSNVDLAEVRRALPDNIFWQMSAPTRDEAEIERRARERERWNVEYGKVLSGTGTDEEIRAYYDQRARMSGDYVEFTTYLLDHYGDELHPRDAQLLKLARQLHLARLEEIPRGLETALQRKAEQDEARARWQAEERAFTGD